MGHNNGQNSTVSHTRDYRAEANSFNPNPRETSWMNSANRWEVSHKAPNNPRVEPDRALPEIELKPEGVSRACLGQACVPGADALFSSYCTGSLAPQLLKLPYNRGSNWFCPLFSAHQEGTAKTLQGRFSTVLGGWSGQSRLHPTKEALPSGQSWPWVPSSYFYCKLLFSYFKVLSIHYRKCYGMYSLKSDKYQYFNFLI